MAETKILVALWANVLSWLVRTFAPKYLPVLLPSCEQEDTSLGESNDVADETSTRCISIGRPGGAEQLRLIKLKPGIATCGYNVKSDTLPFIGPIDGDEDVPADCIVLRNKAFSVNYADVCIRWGLYESANKFVGYPMVPGFDVAGVVERVGSDVKEFRKGDKVFGCSLFGSYSSRVVVPAMQLRRIPKGFTMTEAASLPTVALTSMYALFLAGQTTKNRFNNKAILIHSAAGGVGSMLIQMSKLLGLSPIVGVVGRTAKVEAAKMLGCDVVVDKSKEDLWQSARAASPNGYAVVMESNGVATLSQSYNHLAPTGRLIVFGFHTNLPMGRDALSPIEWLRMGMKMQRMPTFDAMEMGGSNRGILGFNLSFFADEREMLSDLFDQVLEWLGGGKLVCPRVVEMDMSRTVEAHDLIQSGTSIGKIVLTVNK